MIGEKFFNSLSSLSSSELNACIRYSMIDIFNKRPEITHTIKLFKKSKDNFFILLESEEKRDALKKYLYSKEIMTNYGAQCIPEMTFYKDKYKYDVSSNFLQDLFDL